MMIEALGFGPNDEDDQPADNGENPVSPDDRGNPDDT